MKKIILTFCMVPVLICLVGATTLTSMAMETEEQEAQSVYTITDAYEYEVLPGSEEWETFYDSEQKLEACYVPSETMEQMTTEALVETVLNYPLLVDMYAYSSIEIGIQAVSTYFGGIEELLTRPDAEEVLYEYSLRESERTIDTDITCFYCDTLLDYISSNTAETEESSSLMYTTTSLKTPNGSAITTYYNLSWSDHNTTYAVAYAIDQQYLTTYPSATIVANPSPTYNCHSYAWYSQSTSNMYWINDPSAYMSDGSYSSCSASVGCKVFYKSSNSAYNHSGVITKLSSSSAPTTVKSKWGCHSLFSHYINDCPYVNTGYSTSISSWG